MKFGKGNLSVSMDNQDIEKMGEIPERSSAGSGRNLQEAETRRMSNIYGNEETKPEPCFTNGSGTRS